MLKELQPKDFIAGRRIRARSVLPDVRDIVASVAAQGDDALRAFSLRYDSVDLGDGPLRVPVAAVQAAPGRVAATLVGDMEVAYRRLLDFHRQLEVRPNTAPASRGVRARVEFQPIRRVGLYAPAGRAPLFSTVLMVAAAARAAGVGEIAIASPPGPDGEVSPYILTAAHVAGITEVYRIGGAQAIAALAFGTQEVRAVDKIAGPGSRWVAAAKREVYGVVDVDLVAGPSELLVVADGSADPALVAMDLLAQAEHDPHAEVALLALAEGITQTVRREVLREVGEEGLPASLGHADACLERDVSAAIGVADAWAPEHLGLHVRDPGVWIGAVRAGSVFVGGMTPTALGDYVAGPSHVLPTGGSARALSGLTKLHFLRSFTVDYCTFG